MALQIIQTQKRGLRLQFLKPLNLNLSYVLDGEEMRREGSLEYSSPPHFKLYSYTDVYNCVLGDTIIFLSAPCFFFMEVFGENDWEFSF